MVTLSVTPAETNDAQLVVVGGYVASGHSRSGSLSWITMLPVAASRVYV